MGCCTVTGVKGEAVETEVDVIERAIRACYGPGWLLDGPENTSSMRCARAVVAALARLDVRRSAGSPVHEDEDEQRQLEVARQAVLDAMPLSWAEQDPGFAGTAARNIARAVMTALSETVRDA